MQSLIGTGVAVVTPFAVNKEVDFPSLQQTIRHLINGQVEYLVVMGTTGEAATLSQKEEQAVIEYFVEEVNDQVPLVLGIGGNNTRKVANKISDYALRYPAFSAILSVSPYYNKPTQEGIYQHYVELASSSDLPLILYNVPGRTASNLSSETTLRLAHDCPTIVATKEASGKFEQIMDVIRNKPEDFLVLSGDDALSLPLLSFGVKGVISVAANAFPLEFSNMVRAVLEEDLSRAQQLHYELLPMMQLLFKEGNPAGVKMAMHLQGLCQPTVRLPLVQATAALQAEIESAMSRMRVS